MTTVRHGALPLWSELGNGRLYLSWCAECDRYLALGTGVCQSCGGLTDRWLPVSGRGTVWSYSIVRRAFVPSAPWAPPYVVGLVELAEGPKVPGAIVGLDEGQIMVGLPVRLVGGIDGSGDPILAFEEDRGASTESDCHRMCASPEPEAP